MQQHWRFTWPTTQAAAGSRQQAKKKRNNNKTRKNQPMPQNAVELYSVVPSDTPLIYVPSAANGRLLRPFLWLLLEWPLEGGPRWGLLLLLLPCQCPAPASTCVAFINCNASTKIVCHFCFVFCVESFLHFICLFYVFAVLCFLSFFCWPLTTAKKAPPAVRL